MLEPSPDAVDSFYTDIFDQIELSPRYVARTLAARHNTNQNAHGMEGVDTTVLGTDTADIRAAKTAITILIQEIEE